MMYLISNDLRSNPLSSFLLLLLLCVTTLVSAQENPNKVREFGEVDSAHMAMTLYEKDTSAAAVVLFDNGRLGFSYNNNSFCFSYHTQIKMLNSDGFEFADLSLPFEGRKGLSDVKAATHNLENGELVTKIISEDMMVTEEIVDKYRVLKIPFPDVVVGSIIEYSYVMYSQSPFEFLPWYFQGSIPVVSSSFDMFFPQSSDLKPRLYGYNDLHNYDVSLGGRHVLVMKDIPAFEEEAYVKKIDDHYSKVAFEYISDQASSWESLVDVVLEMKGFGTTLEKLNAFNKVFPKEKGWKPDLASLQDIHGYIAEHFEWDGNHGLSFSDKPKKVWEAATGTSADINLTLYMFLRKAGFAVDPVFISTTDHGLINSEFPTFRQFNNVVVKTVVGDQQVLLDATSKLRPYNVLPDACLNDSGLVVLRGQAQWVAMNLNQEKSRQSISIVYGVDELGEISGSGNIQSSGASAADTREALADKDEEQLKERMEKRLPDLEIEEVKYSGLDDVYTTLKADFDFSSDSFTESIGSRVFFSPIVLKELENNPFKLAKRVLPIDFAMPINRRYFFNITISDTYEVEELPEPVNYKLPGGGGGYSYLLQKVDGGIQVMVRFTINRIMFLPEEYPNIREMFNLILAKQEERVVLRKKEKE